MAIMADEIRDVEDMSNVGEITYQYIKYMHEQIEFWGANREKEINQLKAEIAVLKSIISNQ